MPNLMIDDLVKLEFLRDIYVPELRKTKEAFIFKDLFYQSITHQETFVHLNENAILLSKIYKQQINVFKKNTACDASVVDLLLAARIMFNCERELLITGNKKDFSSCIFDIVQVIPFEEEGGNILPFCIIKFNRKKFEESHKKLKELENRKII